MYRFVISLFLSFIMVTIPFTGLAEANEFRIDVYSAGKTKTKSPPDLSKLKFIRSIHVNSISNQYFIYATSLEQQSPQIPPLSSPSLRREILKIASASPSPRQKKPEKLLSRKTGKLPPPRKVTITEAGNRLFSLNTTWPNGVTSSSETTVDPLLMIRILLDIEDCMGRRDIRYSSKHRRWNTKSNDARVLPSLSTSLGYTREQWEKAFNDGILGVDEDWSIYAVVMSSESKIKWNRMRRSHQVVIGFQLINRQSGANLFLQISNWANDNQHRSYDYCDPATPVDSTMLVSQEAQIDGEEQWTPHPIFIVTGIHPPTGDTTNSIFLAAFNEVAEYEDEDSNYESDDDDEDSTEETKDSTPPAYCKSGFQHDRDHDRDDSDDYPSPPGATGCSGCTIWTDR